MTAIIISTPWDQWCSFQFVHASYHLFSRKFHSILLREHIVCENCFRSQIPTSSALTPTFWGIIQIPQCWLFANSIQHSQFPKYSLAKKDPARYIVQKLYIPIFPTSLICKLLSFFSKLINHSALLDINGRTK